MSKEVKLGPMSLIKQFFGLTLAEAKDEAKKLTERDKLELGSAIARERGIPSEDLKFTPIDY